MAAGRIRVSVPEMESAISRYESCKSQFENAYLNMSNVVREVDGIWDGEASEAFKTQFDTMYKNISQTEAKVQDAVAGLRKAIEEYAAAEGLIINLSGGLEVGNSPFEG